MSEEKNSTHKPAKEHYDSVRKEAARIFSKLEAIEQRQRVTDRRIVESDAQWAYRFTDLLATLPTIRDLLRPNKPQLYPVAILLCSLCLCIASIWMLSNAPEAPQSQPCQPEVVTMKPKINFTHHKLPPVSPGLHFELSK